MYLFGKHQDSAITYYLLILLCFIGNISQPECKLHILAYYLPEHQELAEHGFDKYLLSNQLTASATDQSHCLEGSLCDLKPGHDQ